MTVEQLIEELQKIEDKTRIVEVPFVGNDNWCAPVEEIDSEDEGKVMLFSY